MTGYQVRALLGHRLHATSPRSRTPGPAPPTRTPTDSAGTSYSYRVRATDAAGNLSTYSNTASATTPRSRHDRADAARDADARTVVSGSEVDLSWGASTDNDGVTGYQV